MVCVNLFYVLRMEMSIGSNKKMRNPPPPYNPAVKIANFGNVMSIDMTLPKWALLHGGLRDILCIMSIDMTLPKWGIFTTGVYGGNFSFFLSDLTKISFLTLHKKCWRISCKFQFEKASNKKVIVKKPLTNLYEMNNKLSIKHHHVRNELKTISIRKSCHVIAIACVHNSYRVAP